MRHRIALNANSLFSGVSRLMKYKETVAICHSFYKVTWSLSQPLITQTNFQFLEAIQGIRETLIWRFPVLTRFRIKLALIPDRVVPCSCIK